MSTNDTSSNYTAFHPEEVEAQASADHDRRAYTPPAKRDLETQPMEGDRWRCDGRERHIKNGKVWQEDHEPFSIINSDPREYFAINTWQIFTDIRLIEDHATATGPTEPPAVANERIKQLEIDLSRERKALEFMSTARINVSDENLLLRAKLHAAMNILKGGAA